MVLLVAVVEWWEPLSLALGMDWKEKGKEDEMWIVYCMAYRDFGNCRPVLSAVYNNTTFPLTHSRS